MHRWTLLISCLLGMALSAQAAVVAVLDYEKTHGSKGLIETLRQDGSHEVKVIPEIASKNLGGAGVLIVSHQVNLDHRDVIRAFVRQGGGILMTYDAAGSGRPVGDAKHPIAKSTFPEIAESETPGWGHVPTIYTNGLIKPIRKHPITTGIPKTGFTQSYWDHVILCPVDDRMVLMEDSEKKDGFSKNRSRGTQVRWNSYSGGNAVLIAAPFGQGRVVLSALLSGQGRDNKPAALNGVERTLLLNSVHWLAGDAPLNVPQTLKASAPSKYSYTQRRLPKALSHRKSAIVVETRAVAVGGDSGRDPWVRFQLPKSVAPGRSIPVVMDAPTGSAPRAVSIIQADGTVADSVPVQAEKRADGKDQLVFVDSFWGRDVTVVFDSAESVNATGLEVRVNADRSLATITGPHFSLLVGCEGDEPTLQAARIFDWDWHPTWDGLERNNLSAPILRLAESLRPFKATPPDMDHEVGQPFPEVQGDMARTLKFPVRVTLRVGKGRLTVYRTGQVHLENFARSGRIATFLVDRYISNGRDTPETVSYDLPAIGGPWVWAQRDHRYAVGGTLRVLDRMGETGLAPGMERMVSLSGETLILTTDVKHLDRYQVSAVAVSVNTTDLPAGKRSDRQQRQTLLTHPTIRVSQRRLWKMRGTDEFFEILAEPVEIYSDLLARTMPVAQWKIQSDADPRDDNVQIAPAMAGPFAYTVKDVLAIKAMKRADPHNEDPAVWRRLYLRCRDITDIKSTSLKLTGTNEKGETVVVVPIEMHQALSLSVGIFTYGPGWAQYWHWAGRHNGRCPGR